MSDATMAAMIAAPEAALIAAPEVTRSHGKHRNAPAINAARRKRDRQRERAGHRIEDIRAAAAAKGEENAGLHAVGRERALKRAAKRKRP